MKLSGWIGSSLLLTTLVALSFFLFLLTPLNQSHLLLYNSYLVSSSYIPQNQTIASNHTAAAEPHMLAISSEISLPKPLLLTHNTTSTSDQEQVSMQIHDEEEIVANAKNTTPTITTSVDTHAQLLGFILFCLFQLILQIHIWIPCVSG